MTATTTKKKQTLTVTDDKVKDVAVAELETIQIPPNAYKNIFGSFGIITKKDDKITAIQWEGCRDRFQSQTNGEAVMDFLFFHNNGTGDNVVAFLRTLEEVIALPAEDRCEVKKTNNANVLYIKMSGWWKYKLRRSLLTALLRCGQNYTEKTAKGFEKALYSQYYLAQTKPAVEQFLKGRTGSKLSKNAGNSGWYAHFVNQNEQKVRETLVRVTPKTPEEQAAITATKEAERAAKAAEKANAELAKAQEAYTKAQEKAAAAAAKAAETAAKKAELLPAKEGDATTTE